MALVTIKEYAEKYGVSPESIYQKYTRGYFLKGKKYGNQIILDDEEPLRVYRVRNGEYLNNPSIVKVKESRKNGGKSCGANNHETVRREK